MDPRARAREAPDVAPHIFEPFFTTKGPGKGTGLGLATVFGIVQQHHGWIQVDGNPGRGATFHVHVPAAAVAHAEPSRAATAKARTGTETILVAEDNASLRMLTRAMLERHGYQVLGARRRQGRVQRA